MRKRSSKLLAVLLAAGMTLSMAACGKEPVASTETKEGTESVATSETPEEKLYYNETGYPICDETITIKVGGSVGNSPDWNNTAFVKAVEERLGIKLECEPVSADAWSTQYATMLATGNMPDLIVNGTIDKSQVNKDGKAGFWLDLSEYLDIMPNFVALMEEYPEWAAYTQTETGSIYGINRITPGYLAGINTQLYAEKSVLEGAGVDPDSIKTIDDFYDALVKVKEAYPDKIPLSFTTDRMPAYRADVILRTAFGINYNDNSYMLVADDAGKVSLADISDNNRAYMQFINKLLDDGLLDPNCFVVSKDEYRANAKEKKYVFMADAGHITKFGSEGETISDYAVFFGFSSEYTNNEINYVLTSNVLKDARIFVNAKTEYPEAICRLIDYLCTEEGMYLASFGVEGEHYDIVTDQYGLKSVDTSKYADLTTYQNVTEWKYNKVVIDQAFELVRGFLGTQMETLDDAALQKIIADKAPQEYDAVCMLGIKKVDNVLNAIPALAYTEEEVTERSTLYTDILNYVKQMKVSFMNGEVDVNDDAAWDAYVKQVEAMGYERLMKIEQAAYDRYAAGLK